MKHLYANDVIEWFCAESLEEAKELAKDFYVNICGITDDEMDLDLHQVPDEKIMKWSPEADYKFIDIKAKDLAEQNEKGFVGSTEF